MIVVARGGGSLADLFAFCDETLCRTVALLRVPVISSVGHHTDRTLLDDVAAVACSTPTHAAEAAVPVRLRAPPAPRWPRSAARLERQGRRAVVERARTLARLSRAPAAPRRPPPHAPAPAAARAARRDAPRGPRPSATRARDRAAARRGGCCGRAGAARRRALRTPAAREPSTRLARSRSPPTTRSARWSAATRSSRTRRGSRHVRRRGARPAGADAAAPRRARGRASRSVRPRRTLKIMAETDVP